MMKDLPNRIQQPLVSPGTSNVEFSEYSSEYSSLNVPLDDSNRIGMHDPKKDVLSNAGPFRTTKEKPQTFVKIPRSSNTSISYPNRNNGSKSQQQQQQSHTEVSQLEYPKHHISVPSQSFLNAGENPIPGHNFDKNV
jgi:hypothetical protein